MLWESLFPPIFRLSLNNQITLAFRWFWQDGKLEESGLHSSETFIVLWDTVRFLAQQRSPDQPRLKDHLVPSTVFILLWNFHSWSRSKPVLIKKKKAKGTMEVIVNLAARDRERHFSRLQSKLSFWIMGFYKSQSTLMTLPLEMWSHHCKLSEEAVS